MSSVSTSNINHHQLQRLTYIYIYTRYIFMQLMVTYIRSQNAWLRYIFTPLTSAFCSCWWPTLEVETPDWRRYIFIPFFSEYSSWWSLILEVETPKIDIYLYHCSVHTAADDDLYCKKVYLGSYSRLAL